MRVANKKILIELERSNNTTENFRFGFGRFLRKIGCEHRFCFVMDIKEEDLNWCDVYIAVRPNSPMSLSIAKAVRNSGRPYIVFFDDDLLYRFNSIRWRRNSSRKCLMISDCVFGANPALCEEYGRLSQDYFYVNTAVEENELTNFETILSQTQIVYAAGKDHAVIFEKIVRPALKPLIEEYGDRVHFTFVGVEPRLDEIGITTNISFVPFMSLEQYTEYMRTHHFDIGLAPLENDRFSNMKYFNKYIEYGKSAIAGIYSDVKPYTYAVRNGENGYLVGNNYIDWYERIKLCIGNIDETRKIGKKAQEDLRTNYNLDSIAKELEGNLESAIPERKISKVKWRKNNVIELLFNFEDKTGKLLYHFHNRGVKETIAFIRSRKTE